MLLHTLVCFIIQRCCRFRDKLDRYRVFQVDESPLFMMRYAVCKPCYDASIYTACLGVRITLSFLASDFYQTSPANVLIKLQEQQEFLSKDFCLF
jgi:hypothetical protein